MAPTAKPNPRENTPTDVQPFGSGTNKADLKGEPPVKPSPAVGPVNAISLNSSRSNIVDERQAHGTSQYQAARVLSQQGRRLIVQLGNGQRVVVDSSSLNPAPRVGSTVTVTNSRGNWVVVTR